MYNKTCIIYIYIYVQGVLKRFELITTGHGANGALAAVSIT